MTHRSRMTTPRPTLPVLALALLAACGGDAPRQDGDAAPGSPDAPPASTADAPAPPPAPDPGAWKTSAQGVDLRADGDAVNIQTGPHAVVWRDDAPELQPPYTVIATLEKKSGRMHEGIGLIFGARQTDGPEETHRYAYFLTRGDGSFLIKKREGAETPVLKDWTTHPAIQRDADGAGRPNELEVRAGTDVVVFLVNGTEVARLPAAEFQLGGRAGLRVAHDVQLAASGFRVRPGVQP